MMVLPGPADLEQHILILNAAWIPVYTIGFPALCLSNNSVIGQNKIPLSVLFSCMIEAF